MLSKITIELDFENGNEPVIQIMQQTSDDVRDQLIEVFLQKLGHSSVWGRIEYKNPISDSKGYRHRWIIRPIKPADLEVEAKEMMGIVKIANPQEVTPPQSIYSSFSDR